MDRFLAIDLGATSGRHIVGYYNEKGEIVLEKLTRFLTGMKESENGLVWDLDNLFIEIKKGIKVAFEKYPDIKSLSIDTWGVDYVLMNNDKVIKPYYAYRNERVNKTVDKVHAIIPQSELYKLTGIQLASFNTIYQLYDDLLTGRIQNATDFLMLPEYFSYLLTGVKAKEYTNATTTGLVNAYTKEYDFSITEKLGLPRKLFSKLVVPGTTIGKLKPEIAAEVGGNCDVILCASHDTGSAFESVDCGSDSVLISSGTWSLVGTKLDVANTSEKALKANFTNEGGVGYIRFLKNVIGMWIPNSIADELGISVIDIASRLDDVKYCKTFDVNDPSLMAPKSMKEAVLNLLKNNPPKTTEELFASVYHSLALSYDKVIKGLEEITSKKYDKVYIIGGGASNKYLNKLTAQYTHKNVIALPIEGTALGNVKVQMIGLQK